MFVQALEEERCIYKENGHLCEENRSFVVKIGNSLLELCLQLLCLALFYVLQVAMEFYYYKASLDLDTGSFVQFLTFLHQITIECDRSINCVYVENIF